MFVVYFFFFQAEDGIRDDLVTGVQTCALPICAYADEGLLLLVSISFHASFGSGADNYWELALC